MSTYDNQGEGPPKDARAKFAELLRRAERNGERIRLTRRGVPIAYIVPLADGEKLKRFDDMARQLGEKRATGASQTRDPNAIELPLPDAEQPQSPPSPPPPKPQDHAPWGEDAFPEHGDEDTRTMAIGVFRKVITRIMDEKDTIPRTEILRRIKDDGYIGTAVRKTIGEGGTRER